MAATKTKSTTKTNSQDTKARAEKEAIQNGVVVPLYTKAGETKGTVMLPKVLSQVEANPKLIATAMRVYLSSNYQGTASTKTRGEVTGSTRKIYRQKGTGRARHGDIKAPIFVGGGIVFGPKPRNIKRGLPQKMRQKAFKTILAQKVKEGSVRVVEGLTGVSGKTREMATLLAKLGIGKGRLLAVITPGMEKAARGLRNITGVKVTSAHSLSPLDLIVAKHVLLAKEGLEKMPLY